MPLSQGVFLTINLGSGGRIRTGDQLVNSQLRYRCATPEYPIIIQYQGAKNNS